MALPRHNTWFWLPRTHPNTVSKDVFARENILEVGMPGDNSAITGMDIVLTNTFAPIPVIGHNYATAQFIGPGQTQFQITVHNVGTDVITSIQQMVEETQSNARLFRRIKDCARVYFGENAFLQLCGIEDGIVEGVESWTEEGTTDLHGLRITFSVDGQHQEALTQELYSPSSLQWRVIERLIQDISVQVRNRQSNVENMPSAGEVASDVVAFAGAATANLTTLGLASAAFGSIENNGRAGNAVLALVDNVIDQLAEEPSIRLSRSTLSLLRGNTSFQGYMRGVLRGDSAEVSSEGLGEVLSSFIRTARDTTNEVIRTGQLVGTIQRLLDNRIGEFISIPSPVGMNVIQEATYTNNASGDPLWYKEGVRDVIALVRDSAPNLPIHEFFEGQWAGEYLKLQGNATLAQNQSTRNRIRNYENIRRAREEQAGQEVVPNENGKIEPRYGIYEPLDGQGRERFVRTELHNVPSFIIPLLYGTRRHFVRRDDLARPIRTVMTRLLEVGRRIIDDNFDSDEFAEKFPGLREQYIQARRLTVNPAYPDLDLPPHPVTRRVIDTEPDFYFWNDSEESMLNQIGPELDMRLSRRLDRMMESFNSVVSGELWRQTYLGRSMYGSDTVSQSFEFSLSGEPASTEATGETNSPMNVQVNSSTGLLDQLERNIVGPRNSATGDSVSEQVMAISPSVMGTVEDELTNTGRRQMIRNTVYSTQLDEPNAPMRVGPVDEVAARDEDLAAGGYLGHSSTRDNIFNLAKQAVYQSPDETLTMRRAFPTFKLYFIEDDTGPNREHLLPQSRTVAYFDDFYNYNSVKEIRLIRSRKQPDHLLVVTLTNVSGILDQRMWNAQRWDPDTRSFVNFQRENYEPGLQETELENPLDHLILKQGLKVQLRLGNSNSSHKLATKFNGEIVEISYNHSSPDLITIVAQSYGNELVAERKGLMDDNFIGFRDTADLLHSLMCSPELVHFGRFDINPQFNPAEARSRVSEGTGTIITPSRVIDELRQHLIMTKTKWILANNPADDNIFAPDPQSYSEWYGSLTAYKRAWSEALAIGARIANVPAGFSRRIGRVIPGWSPVRLINGVSPPVILETILRKASQSLNPHTYIPMGSTIWEIFKEMELKHPGYIADIRPYGTRMTMFYGIPDQRYWADAITREEVAMLRMWERRFRAVRDDVVTRNITRTSNQVNTGQVGINSPYLGVVPILAGGVAAGDAIARGIYNSQPLQDLFYFMDVARVQLPLNRAMGTVGEYIGRALGRFKPFRKYHMITSDHHILLNNIRSSDKNTFNSVCLTYDNGKNYTLKADDNIPDSKLKTAAFNFPNCRTETMARRYCIGLLTRGLRDVYKGELVITGKNIDPWDAILLYDTYTDMYGPIEVEQVVDTFTRETGWITEITPDMCVHANEYSTTSTMNLMLDIGTELFSRVRSSRPLAGAIAASSGTLFGGTVGGLIGGSAALSTGGLVAGGMLGAGAVLAGLGGYYFFKYTQERQPIWINPLILNNRPLSDGLHGFKQDGVFTSIAGRLEAEVNRVSEGWDAFHLSSYISDWTIGTSQVLGGQSGGGAYSGYGNLTVIQ